MRKKLLLPLLMILFCTACGGGTLDLSGTYTDCQGTTDVYSELELTHVKDDTYHFSMSLYRLALLEGTAELQDGVLHFASEQPYVAGDIAVSGSEASVTVAESEFSAVAPGDVFRFPDGPASGSN